MRVFIYWNLHKKCWSIKALSGENKGRVTGHALAFEVENAVFKVSEAGRQRVLREQRKNVHAGIVGDLIDWQALDITDTVFGDSLELPVACACDVSYNPYKGPSFFRRGDNQALKGAGRVVAVGRTVRALNVS